MKEHLIILSILISSICYGQQNIYEEIKNSVDNEWISTNTNFKKTKSSYFNKENSEASFVFPIQISGLNVPFTWDCDLSILRFLLSQDKDFSVRRGKEADSNYLGTRINWIEKKSSLIWLNDKIYNASVDNWYLFGQTDCVGNLVFPVLNFAKLLDSPNANANGIAIIPYDPNISQIKETKAKLITTDEKEINGTAFDLNNDSILDVFIYEMNDDKSWTSYKRMYVNISGSWICKWSEYDEECI